MVDGLPKTLVLQDLGASTRNIVCWGGRRRDQGQNLFARYESAGNFRTKHLLAEQVFTELELHAQLEENVFYSAYEAMTGKKGRQLVADSRLAHKHVRELMSCGCPPSASGPPPQKGLEVTVWLLDSLRAGSL